MVRATAEDFSNDHLRARSQLTKSVRDLPPIKDILIIDDEPADARWLISALRLVCGQETTIRHAGTLGSALDELKAAPPRVVFLDDHLSPVDSAQSTLPFLRRAGYEGPVVMVSGALTRTRIAELVRLGAVATLHKDDVDSRLVAELLLSIFAPGAPPEPRD